VFAQAGAVVEAREAAADAIARARAADDRQCRGYAHLALADVLPDDDFEGLEHALRAKALLADSWRDDALRVGARLLRRGQPVDRVELDKIAQSADTSAEPRLEWWGARARAEAIAAVPNRPELVLSELAKAFAASAPLGVRGPALAAGARLAARAGQADIARRFALGARDAARELARRAPPELRAAIEALPWLGQLHAPAESEVSAEQVSDVEALVHALGQRDRLRPLLDRVLDALVLWTGVERGLLLLRAPEGRLVVRAARNISRVDLVGRQLELSMSLAERALVEREPVVAVDAAGELPDVHASAHALKLRSVLAVPLISRGEALGVVYLDDRVRRGAFGQKELSWVRLVAALASVAIAEARDQLLLRRAARRAKRAEARLTRELAEREARLDVAERELARTRDARATRFRYDDIIGESSEIAGLLRLVDRVAESDVPVLVMGESGSGKELIARAIHANGRRAQGPFVSENCAAIPESLLESTLFGHARGAFTGASRPRAGLFEVAHGGTLFLDEIGEMSLGMQSKLLRVLEDGEVHAIGSERPRKVDVRVIGATHRDLDALVREGRFRQDLLYRLNVITLRVPSLRERRADIPLLVRHFVSKHAAGRKVSFSSEALERLSSFDWPGNIRQLENEVRRALVLCDERVEVEHLSPELRERSGRTTRPGHELDLRGRVDALEAELVGAALERTGGNQTRAAELLGLSRFGLQKMMKRLAIDASPKPGRRSHATVERPR
jgi:transcriptional regulator with GAF, ATPase, and Fis domain